MKSIQEPFTSGRYWFLRSGTQGKIRAQKYYIRPRGKCRQTRELPRRLRFRWPLSWRMLTQKPLHGRIGRLRYSGSNFVLPTHKIAHKVRTAALKRVLKWNLLNRMLRLMAQNASISVTDRGCFGTRSAATTCGHTWWILILMAARSGRRRLNIILIRAMAMPNTVEHHAGRRHRFHCSIPAISTAQNLATLSNFFNFSRGGTHRSRRTW